MKDVQIVSVALGDPGGDDKQLHLFQAPADSYGGGITIVAAEVTNGAALTAGTVFTLALHKYSNAGTPAVNGTIAAAIGAAGWEDAVPLAMTIAAGFVDAGEYVVADYQEIGSGNPTNAILNIHYIMGK